MDRQLVADYIEKQLGDEMTGHDFYHGQRVARLAERMLVADHPESGQESRDIAFAAGFIHDAID